MYTATMRSTVSYCEYCGAVIPEGSFFCESCGAPVPEPEPEPVMQGNNGFHRGPLIAVAAVMVVLAGCLSGFIFSQPQTLEASHTDKYQADHRYVDENVASDEDSSLDLVTKQPKEEKLYAAQEPKHIDRNPKPMVSKRQGTDMKDPVKPEQKDGSKTGMKKTADQGTEKKDPEDSKHSKNQNEWNECIEKGEHGKPESESVVDPAEPENLEKEELEEPEEAEPAVEEENEKTLPDRIINFFDPDKSEDDEDVDNDKDQEKTEVNDEDQDDTDENDEDQDETEEDEDEAEDDGESLDDEDLDSNYETEDDDDYEEWQGEY